jgi:hypothetical protein
LHRASNTRFRGSGFKGSEFRVLGSTVQGFWPLSTGNNVNANVNINVYIRRVKIKNSIMGV